MAEYIEREALIRAARQDKAIGLCIADIVDVQNLINDQPAADVVEVRHGEWVSELVGEMVGDDLDGGMKMIKYTCSLCGFRHRLYVPWRLTWKYCPNCGAKMDGKGNDDV